MFYMYTELQKSILQTLVYFDLESFPLTKEEVFYYLWKYAPLGELEVWAALKELVQRNKIEQHYGYFYLKGRDSVVEERQKRLLYAEKLLSKARLAIKLINWIPFLRGVFICNSIASETATLQSDIDFFIISAKGRIWTVRFFTNLVLLLCGLRRHGKKVAARICLSFYVSEDNLNLSNQRIFPDDIHFIYWIEHMLPLYDPEFIYDRFRKENAWMKEYLPHISAAIPGENFSPYIHAGKIKKSIQKIVQKILEHKLGDILEKILRFLQLNKMAGSAKKIIPSDVDRGVFVSDSIIKLHEKDTRRWYYQSWQEKIKMYE